MCAVCTYPYGERTMRCWKCPEKLKSGFESTHGKTLSVRVWESERWGERKKWKYTQYQVYYLFHASHSTTTHDDRIRQCKVIFILLPYFFCALLSCVCVWVSVGARDLIFGILFYFNRFELCENVEEWLIFHYRNTIHDIRSIPYK